MIAVVPVLPTWLDLGATAIFALSGALMAARLRQTLVTATFFAVVTGVGGGTIRDLMLDAPVFWLRDPWIAPMALATALLAWFTPRQWWERQILEWLDAAGLAMFSVLGTAKALSYGVAPVPAMVLGIISGCAGGIVRDMVAGVPSIIMRPELYVTAAALSAGLTATFAWAGLPNLAAWTIAAGAGFGLRLAAIVWNIKLPGYSRGKE
ncbi:trimeric intracellular cation channel family protein [Alteraurantiacibacter buctensis]|uniref:Trimeric intracellular cation channel family protein n=1 Tax=Alteraurantiacibacter buctensis TaxID=1503981 RepID=A0A844YSV6_9SPHN|nr:trimeric intracellular cation channel family protein [Alteraurantiacibacter buctensis]MXO71425.1 trimeric intracellular cation channel family protein [Alteraurantiacibacter buctensis]